MSAAAVRTFLAPDSSFPESIFLPRSVLKALADASNSTGSVRNWNNTTSENNSTPIYISPVAPNTSPSNIIGHESDDPILASGMTTDLILIGK